jgi:hypothetical protein
MADTDWGTEQAKIGYLAQEKVDFYVVALAFTVLGLSVQTAHFGASAIGDFFELVGWISLLTSGIAGVARVQLLPHTYQLMGLLQTETDKRNSARRAQAQGLPARSMATGKDVDPETVIATFDESIRKIKDKLSRTVRRSTISYWTRSLTLLLGLMSLVIARGIEPLLELLHAL